MAQDTMRLVVLPDGTIKTTTDPISKANHQSAEAFLRTVTELTGGEAKREKRTDAKEHHHHHDEETHLHN